MKSSSSEESVRKRRPSGNMSVNSQLSIFSQQQQQSQQQSQQLSQQSQQSSQQQQQFHQQQPSSIQTIESSSSSLSIEQAVKYPMHNVTQPQHHQQQQQQQNVHQLLNEKIDSMVNNNKMNTGLAGGGGGGGDGSSGGRSISNEDCDFHYDSVDNVKVKYNYHDEPHSFENSMDFLEDFNHFQFEVLETTV